MVLVRYRMKKMMRNLRTMKKKKQKVPSCSEVVLHLVLHEHESWVLGIQMPNLDP